MKKYRFEKFKRVLLSTENEICFGTFKKLARNSEYSKSDDFKKLSVLTQILCFMEKNDTCMGHQ